MPRLHPSHCVCRCLTPSAPVALTGVQVCRFTVVPLDHPLLQQNDPSEDSDYD